MDFAHVSRLYLMNWLVYIHCYSQIHFVSSLICSLSRASRRFYVSIELIHLCKDCCCVIWRGGLLLVWPHLEQWLTWRHQDAWVVNPRVPLAHLGKPLLHHLWPLWPWSQSGTSGVFGKQGSVSLVVLRVLVMAKAANRCPQTKPVRGMRSSLLFLSFPDFNFHHCFYSLSPLQSA